MASETVRHGGGVVCAAVSSYRATRDDVRKQAGTERFVEVFVNTPLAVCEERDTKAMYARARRCELKKFTGISDPYLAPENPEADLDTVANIAETNANLVLDYIKYQGFVR